MGIATVDDNVSFGFSPPTRVRYWILGLATVMAVLLYLDRYCLTFIQGYVREELGLTNRQMDVLVGAFFLSYGLGQVPSGWLSDRYGSRLMLSLYILLWSIFTGVMGLTATFALLLAFRLGCGLAQAGAYPTGALIVSKWMPPSQRGLGSGIISMGGRVGAVLAPTLTAYLLVAFVPSGKSRLLDSADIFDSKKFCEDLVLPHEKRPRIDVLAEQLRNRLSTAAIESLRQGAEKAAAPLSAEEIRSIVQELNEIQLHTALYDLVNPDDFDLPPVDGTKLTPAESERRNRLLLENAFPGSIRKFQGLGWRPTVYVYGAVGIGFALAFWLLVRDSPRQHPRCNAAEVALISGSDGGTAEGSRAGRLPFGYILRSRSLWLSSLSQFTTNFGWVFIVAQFARYLSDEHHVPVILRGWMTAIPILMGIVGMLYGGWLTDRLTRSMGLFWGRCLPMSATRFVAMVAFGACIFLDSSWAVTIALGVVAMATDLGTPAIWAFMQDTGGKYVGSALGWGNMWGNFGAFLSPIVLGLIIEKAGWNTMFLICAAAFLISGIAAFGVDARIPLVPKDADLDQPI
jgi:nitrate/nitrite transporter NarK